MRLTDEFQSMVMEESDSYSKMDKKPGDVKRKLLLLLSATAAFIMTVMVFVLFCYQQRKFADLEKSLRSQNSSVKFEMRAGSDLDKNTAELKNMVTSLNQTFSTSIKHSQLNNGSQSKTSDVQTLINNLSSLSTTLETKLQDMASQSNMLSEIKTSVLGLSSSVNSLSSKLQITDMRVMRLLSKMSDLKTKLENDNKTVPLCKAGWARFQSKCYFFSKDLMNWNEARNYCRSENGMLVKVETDDELDFLTFDMNQYWVGLTDETTSEWRWDDGSPFVRNADWWNEGQPDNWDGHGLGGGEDCGHLKMNGKLNDNHCSVKMQYICQM